MDIGFTWYIDRGICRLFSLLTCTSVTGQLVHPVGGEKMWLMGVIVISATCEHNFISTENLVQHQNINISIKLLIPFAKITKKMNFFQLWSYSMFF